MAFAPMLPYMVGGFAVDKMMGGTGMTGAMLGTGLGAAGGFGGLAGELGLSGVTALPSATAVNSLGAGSGLMGGVGTAASGVSALPTAANASLLGSPTGNMIPGYDMGMNGIQANLGGFTAPAEQTLLASNSYQPLGGGIAPDMSFKQEYINMTPEVGVNRLGTAQTPDYVGAINTSDASKQGLTNQEAFGYSDGIANPQSPNFSNVTKSTTDELASAQGGYEKPLHERAFDSVVGFAEQNPMAVAGLGLTALSSANRPAPPITAQQAGKVIQGTYTQPTPYKMRRA